MKVEKKKLKIPGIVMVSYSQESLSFLLNGDNEVDMRKKSSNNEVGTWKKRSGNEVGMRKKRSDNGCHETKLFINESQYTE